MRKVALRAVLFSGALSVSAFHPAYSDDTSGPDVSASNETELQEVTVVARRREENLQKVPETVTALSEDVLERQNIIDTYGLLSQLPGVQNISKTIGNASQNLLKIRGVAPVAFYFNDAPYPSLAWSLFAPYFDIASVQVLNGPQGTLFGQASNAGALLTVPKRPGETFGGYLEASGGNYDFRQVSGAVDLPLIPDRLYVRLAATSYYRSPYTFDALSGAAVDGGVDYDVERLSLVWKITDSIENYAVVQREKDRGLTGTGAATPGDYDFLPNALNTRLAALNGMTFAQLNAARDQILANQQRLGLYKTQGWSMGCPASALRAGTISTVPGPNLSSVNPQSCTPGGGWDEIRAYYNTTTWSINDDYSLKNIASHVDGWTRPGLYDNDATRLIGNDQNPANTTFVNPLDTTWSDELQFHGSVLDKKLDFVLGLFAFDDAVKPIYPTYATFTTSTAIAASKIYTRTQERAAFLQGNYNLSQWVDGLTFTGGLRYTHSSAFRKQDVVDPNTFALISSNGGPGTPSGEGHWNATSYTWGPQYQINPNLMVYFTNAKGYSAGGVQNVVGAYQFQPDTLNNFELGFKSLFHLSQNWVVRPNVAAYFGLYDNVKVTTYVPVVVPGSTAATLASTTANAAKARIGGFDFDMSAAYGDLLEFRAFASREHPYYTRFDYINPLTGAYVNLKDQPIALAPTWKFGFSPVIHLPIDRARFGDVSVGADASYRSKFWANPIKPIIPNDPTNPDTGAICMARRTAANGYGPLSADGQMAYKDCAPDFYNINMHVSWDDILSRKGLAATLTITNVNNNKRIAGVNSQYDTLNADAYQPNEPRFVYLTIKSTF